MNSNRGMLNKIMILISNDSKVDLQKNNFFCLSSHSSEKHTVRSYKKKKNDQMGA